MCILLLPKQTIQYNTITNYSVDANLDSSDNVISGYEPSSEMLTSQSKNRNEPKQVMTESRPR